MISNIVFYILLLIAVAWSIGCISTSHGRTMVFTTLVLWLVVAFFWTQKDISRLHILWSAPLLVIIESAIEIPIRRKLRDRSFRGNIMSSCTNTKALTKLSLDLLVTTLKEIQLAHKETSPANEKYFATAEYLLQEAMEYVTGAWEMIRSGKLNASIALSRWVLEASLNLMWTTADAQKVDERHTALIGEALRKDACLFEGYAILWSEIRDYCEKRAKKAREVRKSLAVEDIRSLETRVGEISKPSDADLPRLYPLYRICCAAAHPNLKVWERFGIRNDDSTFPKDPVGSQSRARWIAPWMAAASTYYLILSAYVLVGLGDADVLKQWWSDQVRPLL